MAYARDTGLLTDAAITVAQRLAGRIPPERLSRGEVDGRPDGASLQEIGHELGLSHEAVRLIERRALAKCRRWCARHGLLLDDVLVDRR